MKLLEGLGVALLLLCATAVFAQKKEQLPPLTEKVEVTVVNVDVTVTDNDGKPVSGLTIDDFEVFEDGKKQQLTGFYMIESSLARLANGDAIETTGESAEDFRRRVVLMVDNTTMSVVQRDAALDKVQRFINESFEEDYEWSVVSLGSSVETIQALTNRKEPLTQAIDRLRKMPTFESGREADRRIMSDPLYKYFQGLSDSSGSGYDFNASARFAGQEATMKNLHATMKTAGAFIQTCRAYSNVPGKKVVVMITGGIETNTDLQQFKDSQSGVDRNIEEMKRNQAQILDVMAREANAANFNVYVLNAKGIGLLSPAYDVTNRSLGVGSSQQISKQGTDTKPVDLTDVSSTSLTLALGTGGLYLPGNVLLESLRTVDEHSANYYSLGYTPPHPGDGKYHEIKVRVKKPGLNIHHGESYTGFSTDQRFEQALRSPMSFPKEKGTLPVALALGVPDTANRERSVPVTVSMPMERLTMFPKDANYVGRVHVYTAIYDGTGANIGFEHHTQDLSVPLAQVSQIKGKPFRYTEKVALEKGDYTVVVTLRDDISNEFGTAFTDLRL